MTKLLTLGKYELIKRIAVGGMSEIYLASQSGLQDLDRAVIVKCIREDLDTEREVLDMFLDEARIASCLKHPNIVHLYDVGEDRKIPYLAMEYIFGRNMLQICERARSLSVKLPIQFVLKVMCDSLAGLHYAHFVTQYGDRPLKVVHRDISPQNILVSFDGVSKLVDFGIAKAASRLSKTQVGVLKGKYSFMSPEQVRGKEVDHRSDQFALAVLFYEALTGTRLFGRDSDLSTMKAVDRCDIPSIRVLRKDIPRRINWIFRKALRFSPDRRFTSCREMERAIDAFLMGSSMEQSEQVSQFMRKLFVRELQARDRAIARAKDNERKLLMATGFEMLNARDLPVKPIPAAPIANERYQQIMGSRRIGRTWIRGKSLQKDDATSGEANARSWVSKLLDQANDLIYDRRFWLIAALALILLTSVLTISLCGRSEAPEPETEIKTDAPQPQPQPKPGVDGFLSVAVRPTVTVTVDGKKIGEGAIQKHILPAGKHQVVLRDTKTGAQESQSVTVKADEDTLLYDDKWQ